VKPRFEIGLHLIELPLLLYIKNYFKVGSIITYNKNKRVFYVVTKLKDLNEIIIPHFNQFPLLTQKQADFKLFKFVIELMEKKKNILLLKDYKK
jgi:hypothetical protein